MSLFDGLNRFVSDLMKSLKPEDVVKLRSCKKCSYYKKGYCTQTPVPTKILSEYYAQGCLFFSPQETVIPSPRKVEIGQQIQLTGLNWFDRNPKIGYVNWGQTPISSHGGTAHAGKTVPKNKIWIVEYLYCKVVRQASHGGAVGASEVRFLIKPVGETAFDSIQAYICSDIVGDKSIVTTSSQMTLYSGDKLYSYSTDLSAEGGSLSMAARSKYTEFDV